MWTKNPRFLESYLDLRPFLDGCQSITTDPLNCNSRNLPARYTRQTLRPHDNSVDRAEWVVSGAIGLHVPTIRSCRACRAGAIQPYGEIVPLDGSATAWRRSRNRPNLVDGAVPIDPRSRWSLCRPRQTRLLPATLSSSSDEHQHRCLDTLGQVGPCIHYFKQFRGRLTFVGGKRVGRVFARLTQVLFAITS